MFSNKKTLSGPIKHLIDTARTLQTINQCLEQALDIPGNSSCYASRLHQDQLTLMVPDAHSLTWIKYQERTILTAINAIPDGALITRIRYKVSPHLESAAPTASPPVERGVTLSPEQLHMLQQSTQHIHHPGLQQALSNLLHTVSLLTKDPSTHSA